MQDMYYLICIKWINIRLIAVQRIGGAANLVGIREIREGVATCIHHTTK
jgi:hypothetical protein